MKSTLYAALAATAASYVAAHATFQDLWIDGVDQGSTCARLPVSNSPIQDVTSDDIICNAGTSPAASKCSVQAGSTVTVEMHQQPGDRSCANEAIGGAHYGPVQVYLAAVADASSASASSSASWFKIFADTWAANPSGSSGDDDFWGTKDLNTCCGRLDAVIPADLAPGDYLLRAEALALHTAGSTGGAQFYVTCFQLTVEGSGSAAPEGVAFPGAYAASDVGILVDIHAPMTTYVAPGPTVYAGGSTKSAGAACAGCESTCAAGASSTLASAATTSAATATTATTSVQTAVVQTPTTLTTSTAQATSTSTAGCQVSLYGQCGGSGFTGCTTCGAGTCNKLNDYYSQCTN